MKKITIKTSLIEGKERLKLYFGYDKEVVALVKTIPGARWDPAEKCWHVATQAGPVGKLNHLFEGRLHFDMDGKTGGREDGKTGGREDGKTRGREDCRTGGREDNSSRQGRHIGRKNGRFRNKVP